MKISKKMEAILNDQLQKEFYSANLYMAMGTWADDNGFAGCAQWFYTQGKEEMEHMEKFRHFIIERRGRAIVPALEKPPVDFKNLKTAFEKALAHEEFVTDSIHKIMDAALKEKDYATVVFLQWFVEEQVEEEAQVAEILDKLKLVGTNYIMLDTHIMKMRD